MKNPARVISIFFALLSLLVGLTVMVGWWLHSNLVHDTIVLKFNSALAFALVGSVLLIRHFKNEDAGWKTISNILSVAIAIIGLLTLAEHIFHVNLGIDELFVSDNFKSNGLTEPGRMFPVAACNVLIIGIGLLLLDNPFEWAVNFQVFLLIGIAFDCILILLAIRFVSNDTVFIKGGIVGAISFMITITAMAFAQPRLFNRLKADTITMMGFVVALVLVLVMGRYVFFTNDAVAKTSFNVEQSRYVVSQVDQTSDLESDLSSVATNQDFLSSYKLYGPVLNKNISQLKRLAGENPAETGRIDSLVSLSGQLMKLASRNNGTTEEAVIGHNIFEKIKELTLLVKNDEDALLRERIELDNKSRTAFKYVMNTMTVTGIIILLIVFLVVRYNLMKRTRAEERLSLAFEGTAAGLWDWNIVEEKMWWSPNYFDMLGYKDDEVTPSRDFLIASIHPHDVEHFFNTLEAHLKQGGRFDVEARFKTKQGDYKWFHFTGKSKFNESGKAVRMVGSTIDVDQKRNAQNIVSQQAALIQMVPDGIIYTDSAGNIISLNEGAETMFGFKSAEAKGKYIERLVDVNFLSGNKVDDLRTFDETGYLRSEMEITNAEGQKFIVLATLKRVENMVGAEPGVITIYTDISPLRLNEELKDALSELKMNNEYLEQLAYISSHDIKSPIITLDGLVRVLADTGTVKPEQQEIMRMLRNTLGQMARTNNSLNNILRLRKTLLNKEEAVQLMALDTILEDVKVAVQANLDEAKGGLQIDDGGFSNVLFPEVHLKSVLFNLVSNAIKYRDPERKLIITVAVRMVKGDKYMFTIADNGMGINLEQHRTRLFGIFKRFHDHVEGAGVGLHIVKSVVEAYDGQIEVDSTPGIGSKFKFTFTSGSKAFAPKSVLRKIA